jgi:5-methylcytosine-specific restriction endonuclease McrA
VSTRDEVLKLLEQGWTQIAIAEELGVARSTVSYHARRRRPPDARFARRHDWDAIQRFYDEGHSIADCHERFGVSRKAFMDAVARGAVRTRPQAMPVDELLSGRRNRSHIKGRLVRLGLLEDACAECGTTTWLGQPLSLHLHHVNGDPHDHRLENLQVLCPNCHSQTDTFGGRNRGRRKLVPTRPAPDQRTAP